AAPEAVTAGPGQQQETAHQEQDDVDLVFPEVSTHREEADCEDSGQGELLPVADPDRQVDAAEEGDDAELQEDQERDLGRAGPNGSKGLQKPPPQRRIDVS